MKSILSTLATIALISTNAYSQFSPNYIAKPRPGQEFQSETQGWKIDLVGAASMTGGNTQEQARGATGFAAYKDQKWQISAVFSLATTSTTTFDAKTKSGSFLLLPGNGQSVQVDTRYYNGKWFGFSGSFVAAKAQWNYQNVSYDAAPIALKLHASGHLEWNTDVANVFAALDAGFTYRGYIDDAAQEHDLKQAIFGATQTGFSGFELAANVWINDVHFFANIPYLFGNTVKGLTGAHLNIGVIVSGSVLNIKK